MQIAPVLATRTKLPVRHFIYCACAVVRRALHGAPTALSSAQFTQSEIMMSERMFKKPLRMKAEKESGEIIKCDFHFPVISSFFHRSVRNDDPILQMAISLCLCCEKRSADGQEVWIPSVHNERSRRSVGSNLGQEGLRETSLFCFISAS